MDDNDESRRLVTNPLHDRRRSVATSILQPSVIASNVDRVRRSLVRLNERAGEAFGLTPRGRGESDAEPLLDLLTGRDELSPMNRTPRRQSVLNRAKTGEVDNADADSKPLLGIEGDECDDPLAVWGGPRPRKRSGSDPTVDVKELMRMVEVGEMLASPKPPVPPIPAQPLALRVVCWVHGTLPEEVRVNQIPSPSVTLNPGGTEAQSFTFDAVFEGDEEGLRTTFCQQLVDAGRGLFISAGSPPPVDTVAWFASQCPAPVTASVLEVRHEATWDAGADPPAPVAGADACVAVDPASPAVTALRPGSHSIVFLSSNGLPSLAIVALSTEVNDVKTKLGLAALDNVVRSLRAGHSGSDVPFRDSKLTKALSEGWLDGDAVFCLSVDASSAASPEVQDMLKYASRLCSKRPPTRGDRLRGRP